MNDADFTRLQRGDLATLLPQGWELQPEPKLRLQCLGLAIDYMAGDKESCAMTVAVAERFYKFITGDLIANLYSTKQDQR